MVLSSTMSGCQGLSIKAPDTYIYLLMPDYFDFYIILTWDWYSSFSGLSPTIVPSADTTIATFPYISDG